MLGHAIAIAAEAFKGKADKGGKPYILHCLHVMNEVHDDNAADDDELKIIAVLHDLFEDTTWGPSNLRDLGFSERVISALVLLTHVKGTSYDDYIKRLANNDDAKRVKRADLRHNSDIMRMKGLRKKDFDRLEKYHRSYAYLSD